MMRSKRGKGKIAARSISEGQRPVSQIVDDRTGTITDPDIRRVYRMISEDTGTSVDGGLIAECFLSLVLRWERSGQDALVEACRNSFRPGFLC
jgi:hypothetical protein